MEEINESVGDLTTKVKAMGLNQNLRYSQGGYQPGNMSKPHLLETNKIPVVQLQEDDDQLMELSDDVLIDPEE